MVRRQFEMLDFDLTRLDVSVTKTWRKRQFPVCFPMDEGVRNQVGLLISNLITSFCSLRRAL